MQEQSMKEEFTRQSWYVWSEGFRTSFREFQDIARAIGEANLLTEAFEKKFNTEGK